jgi:LAO/AO transport system kinase
MQDVSSLVAQAREGRPRAVARLISLVEGASEQLREVMVALAPLTGNAYVVGLTGSPGVGKSTSTSALVTAYRKQGRRVGVLAVDPSSPFSGGALLGDRVRMSEHASDPGVYIRSMATRGHLGGLAWAAPQAIRVLDAAGCEVILVETVGVGQSEVEIASQADTSVVLLAPGMGDGIQAAKAGILEIGDVYVVNKADRDGADATARELNHMLGLGEARGPGDWRPPIVKTVAARGEGVDEVVEALEKHRAWMEERGVLAERRLARASREVETIAVTALRERIGDLHGDRRRVSGSAVSRAPALPPQVLGDGLQGLVQLRQRLGVQQVDEVPAHGRHMMRRDLLHGLHAVLGEDRVQAPAVGLAVLAAHQVRVLHPRDLVGEAALGLEGGGREVAHPHPYVLRLGEIHQDLVVVHCQAERLQVLFELIRQQPVDLQVGAPGALLRIGQPARGRLGLHE